jgi:hypothetical protein
MMSEEHLKKLEQELKRLLANLDLLENYIETVAPVLERPNFESTDPRHLRAVAAFMGCITKAAPHGDTVDDLEALKELGEVEQEFDGDKLKSISFRPSNAIDGKGFDDALRRGMRSVRNLSHLRQSSLISLTSFAEIHLAHLLHLHYAAFPESFDGKQRSLTLEELANFDTIADARAYLTENRIEDVTRGDFNSWIHALKALGFGLGYETAFHADLVEVFQRRNLIVHNDGFVNRIYSSKTPKEAKFKVASGHAEVTEEYLESAISLVRTFFVLVTLEYWKKHDPASERRGSLSVQCAYEALQNEQWEEARQLGFFITQDKRLPEECRLMGEVNRWLGFKWAGRFEEIRQEVAAADFSGKAVKFKLALDVLLDREDDLIARLDELCEHEHVTVPALKEWPLFRRLRTLPKFQEWMSLRDDSKAASSNSAENSALSTAT